MPDYSLNHPKRFRFPPHGVYGGDVLSLTEDYSVPLVCILQALHCNESGDSPWLLCTETCEDMLNSCCTHIPESGKQNLFWMFFLWFLDTSRVDQTGIGKHPLSLDRQTDRDETVALVASFSVRGKRYCISDISLYCVFLKDGNSLHCHTHCLQRSCRVSIFAHAEEFYSNGPD